MPNKLESIYHSLSQQEMEVLIRMYTSEALARLRLMTDYDYASIYVVFTHRKDEPGKWHAHCGQKGPDIGVDGELLMDCISEVSRRTNFQNSNKLALLAPPPVEAPEEDHEAALAADEILF